MLAVFTAWGREMKPSHILFGAIGLNALMPAPAIAAGVATLDPVFEEAFDYPGSVAVADGKGRVGVKVVFLPAVSCTRITGVREGMPNPDANQPTDRHLYVTVDIAKTTAPCSETNTPLETRIVIPDKPGRISIDIFVVDERGFLTRSQRHFIQR
jgi:hypothetical protein